jgi:hypothetical protein
VSAHGAKTISELTRNFENAFTDRLAECNDAGTRLARTTRLAKARGELKAHSEFNDSEYARAVDRVFYNLETELLKIAQKENIAK